MDRRRKPDGCGYRGVRIGTVSGAEGTKGRLMLEDDAGKRRTVPGRRSANLLTKI